MVKWTSLNTKKINRVGYNNYKKSLYIDFKGSEIETIYLEVPEEMYDTFIKVKSPDKFYTQLVDGYFEILTPSVISSDTDQNLKDDK